MKDILTYSPTRQITMRFAELLLMGMFVGECCADRFQIDFFNDGRQGPPVRLICEGQVYKPPLSLSATSKPDRSSPESLMAVYFAALSAKDVNLYNGLYVPTEQTTTLAAGPADRIDWLELDAKIHYGAYTIIAFRLSANNQVGRMTRAMKLVGTNYYFTDSLIRDRTYDFIRNFFYQTNIMLRVVPGANTDTNVAFQTSSYPFSNNVVGPPIIVEYRGVNYGTSRPLQFGSFAKKLPDLSRPELAIEEAYQAIATSNLNSYLSLVRPNELDMPLQAIAGKPQTIRQSIETNFDRVNRVFRFKSGHVIRRVIYYEDYALVTIRTSGNDESILVVKQDGNRWMLTSELDRGEDILGNFLLDRRHPHTLQFYSNILPQ